MRSIGFVAKQRMPVLEMKGIDTMGVKHKMDRDNMVSEQNVFKIDKYRHELANSGDLDALKDTYSGTFPEMEDLSTLKKWDQLLIANESVPIVRIERLEKVVSLIQHNDSILDIGVGWGDIIPILKNKWDDVNYTGVDISEQKILELRKKYNDLKFLTSDINDISEKFGVVLLLEVMEHILPSNIFRVLGKVKTLVREGGYLIVSVPYEEELEKTTFVCGECGSFVNRMGHVRSYTEALLEAELSLVGFKMIEKYKIYGGYSGVFGKGKRRLRNLLRWLWNRQTYQPLKADGMVLKFVHADTQ